MFEHFEHTADLGLRVQTTTREQLFQEAARGLTAMLVANPKAVEAVDTLSLRVNGSPEEELDYLLFDWLSELLHLFETRLWLLRDCSIQFDAGGLQATCHGESVDRQRHQLDHEVKAITYHGFVVEPTADGWRCEVIVDI